MFSFLRKMALVAIPLSLLAIMPAQTEAARWRGHANFRGHVGGRYFAPRYRYRYNYGRRYGGYRNYYRPGFSFSYGQPYYGGGFYYNSYPYYGW